MKYIKIIGHLLLLPSLLGFSGLAAAACSGAEDRYVLQNSDTEVLDNTTGLIWQRCSAGLSDTDCTTGGASAVNWKAAIALADEIWRLPNVKELASLLEAECTNPSINITLFPATSTSAYWTATPDTAAATNAWQVDFAAGATSSAAKTAALQVRLVRNQ